MTQDDINQAEWSNPQNWSWLCYRSVRDSRMFVPKRWGFGWTVNFGNRNSVFLFVALLAIPMLSLLMSRMLRLEFPGK